MINIFNYLHLARDVQVVPRHSLSPGEQVGHRAHHVPEHRRNVALLAAVAERLRLEQVLQSRGHCSEDGGGRLEVAAEQGPSVIWCFTSYEKFVLNLFMSVGFPAKYILCDLWIQEYC